MPTMFVSKGRFFVMVTGLLLLTAYLGVALSWNGGLSISNATESEPEQHANQTEDVVINAVEEEHISVTDTPTDSDSSDVPPEKLAGNSAGPIVTMIEVKTGEDIIAVNADETDSTNTSDAVIVSQNNPLDSMIDVNVPSVAKAALTADFQSLVETGVDVSTAVRYIDQRAGEGKYGEGLTQK